MNKETLKSLKKKRDSILKEMLTDSTITDTEYFEKLELANRIKEIIEKE